MTTRLPALGVGSAVLCLSAVAAAQVNVQWVSFSRHPEKLAMPATSLSSSTTQVVFRTADFDQDAWEDVVAVRKEPGTLPGKRSSVLLMNGGGVLRDQTAQYAALSDAANDFGFLTPRGTTEAAIADVDGDGWLDVVTANTLSDGAPKSISHPSVFMNQGRDHGGAWLGFLLEHARIPQLLTFGSPPLAVAPRFAGLALGDVTGDGFPDAYFVDHDITGTGIPETVGTDLNDRLLVNDGQGYFTDQSAARLTTAQLQSAFGSDAAMADVNADGLLDIVKVTTGTAPTTVRIFYNDANSVGAFTPLSLQDVATAGPYGMDVGNLNNDGFMDIVVAQSGRDKFRLGMGYDALNRMVWGPLKDFAFLFSTVEAEYGRGTAIKDLDNDGWNDVVITDDYPDAPMGCSRRLHIYHNTGSVPGDLDLVLKEEAEFANSGSTGIGWKGVVGMTVPDLKGTYSAALADFDEDGDTDLLLGSCPNGTVYWQNELIPQVTCQTDLGFGGPGSMSLSLCGDDLTQAASLAQLELGGAAPSTPLFIALGLSAGPVPFKGGQLVPLPVLSIISGFMTDGGGNFSVPVTGAAGTPLHVFLQVIVKDGTAYELSNGLDVLMGV